MGKQGAEMKRMKLIAARYEKGWSQEEAAEQLDVNRTTVSHWERGVADPYPLHVHRLCVVFEKTAEELDLVRRAGNETTKISSTGMKIQSSEVQGLIGNGAFKGIGDVTKKASLNVETLNKLFTETTAQWIEATSSSDSYRVHPKHPALDWGEAPSAEQFYGREQELMMLKSWITEDQCRISAIFGMGGIGKTSLAVALVETVKDTFEYIFWRSLQHGPRLRHLLHEAIKFFSSQQQIETSDEVETQLMLLMNFLREHRCLFVLDNCETVFQSGIGASEYREGYEDYGKLFLRVGESAHQSCLLLTSREKPAEIARLEGKEASTRSRHLVGIGLHEGREILKDKELFGSDEDWSKLIELYSGNPLALKLIAEPIRELFSANIFAFLQEETVLVEDIQSLLDQQFERLSEREKALMYWLALEREPTSLEALWKEAVGFISKKEVFDSLISLRRRSVIEISVSAQFTLQPVVMEYVTDVFLMHLYEELTTRTLHLLASHALMKAQAKEYLREAQIRLIVYPLVEQLLMSTGRHELEKTIQDLLVQLRQTLSSKPRYAAGNLLNLLIQMHADLSVYDFSSLPVRQAFLQGVLLPKINFSYADLAESIFTDTFGSILSVAFHPRSPLLAAGTTKNDIRLWHIPNGTPHQTFAGHSGWVRTIAFHPDGSILASGSDDQTIRLWDVETGTCLKTFHGHNGWVRSLMFSPDGSMLASGGEDHLIRLWDIDSAHCTTRLQGHTSRIRTLAFHPDGNILASGSDDQMILLWDIQRAVCINVLQGHKARVRTLAFHPDGSILASGSDDQTIRLWDVESGVTFNTLRGHVDCIRSVDFHPDGELLASGSEDRTVRLWDIKKGYCLKTLQGHTNWVWSIAFSTDGSMLASGSEDQTVCLWETKSGYCLKMLQGYINWVWSMAFHPDGSMLATCGEDQAVRLLDTTTGRCLRTFVGHISRVRSVAWSPDGTMLISSSEDRTLRFWSVNSGRCLTLLNSYPYRMWSIALSPSGNMLATGGEDQDVCLWSVPDGKRLQTLTGHTDRVRAVAFHRDGIMVASSSEDQTVRLWDITTGQCVNELQGHVGRVWSVAFHPNGKLLISGGDDRAVRVWDIETGKCLHVLDEHANRVRTVAFSPDGRLFASGSEDMTIRLWETKTGKCLTVLSEHQGQLRSVAFQPNEPTLVSSSDDGTIKFWDLDTLTCRQTLRMQKPYEQMNITGAKGLTADQKTTLKALGAFEEYL